MTLKHIPYFVDPPFLSPSLIEEITNITFGEPVDPKPCDIIFIFGGSHPGLWEKGAEAYFNGFGKVIVATGGTKPDPLRHHSWADKKTPESEVIRWELVRLGVPQKNIYLETQSTNTYENVRFAVRSLQFQHCFQYFGDMQKLCCGQTDQNVASTNTYKYQYNPLLV